MKVTAIILGILLVILQVDLWFGEGSLTAMWQFESETAKQERQNKRLQERNQALAAEVRDLKSGMHAVEERARTELGMVKENETFYQIVDDPQEKK